MAQQLITNNCEREKECSLKNSIKIQLIDHLLASSDLLL